REREADGLFLEKLGGCVRNKFVFFFSSRRRHTRLVSDGSSDVCSSDLDLAIEVFELGVAIRVTRTFSGFAVGLQTVSEIVQQIRDHAVARLMPHAPQLSRPFAKALAGPA